MPLSTQISPRAYLNMNINPHFAIKVEQAVRIISLMNPTADWAHFFMKFQCAVFTVQYMRGMRALYWIHDCILLQGSGGTLDFIKQQI